MGAFEQDAPWRAAQGARRRQHVFGLVSGILFAIALAALLDGLIAQMRQGSGELEFLPGQVLTVSGPAVLKNPLASDLVARFTPAGAPFVFDLEGFYTGYWFGNGMWRGIIRALPEAESGAYALRISFRGASARTAQTYGLKLYADAAAMRAASLSVIRRYLDVNPFILAAFCGLAGIACGIATYFFGSQYAGRLAALGLAEIYAVDKKTGSICCLAPGGRAPAPGSGRQVLDSGGNVLGEARTLSWKKGRLWLEFAGADRLPAGALVCFGDCQGGHGNKI